MHSDVVLAAHTHVVWVHFMTPYARFALDMPPAETRMGRFFSSGTAHCCGQLLAIEGRCCAATGV